MPSVSSRTSLKRNSLCHWESKQLINSEIHKPTSSQDGPCLPTVNHIGLQLLPLHSSSDDLEIKKSLLTQSSALLEPAQIMSSHQSLTELDLQKTDDTHYSESKQLTSSETQIHTSSFDVLSATSPKLTNLQPLSFHSSFDDLEIKSLTQSSESLVEPYQILNSYQPAVAAERCKSRNPGHPPRTEPPKKKIPELQPILRHFCIFAILVDGQEEQAQTISVDAFLKTTVSSFRYTVNVLVVVGCNADNCVSTITVYNECCTKQT